MSYKLLGALGKGYGQICLKFGILKAWLIPGFVFFYYFLKILIFGPWGLGPGSLMDRKPLDCSREGINGQIHLKFGTVIAWVYPWGLFFISFKFGFSGPGVVTLDPKWTKNLDTPGKA